MVGFVSFMLPIHQKTLKRFGKDSWKTISSHQLTSKDKCLEILVTAESQTEVLPRLWILQGHYLFTRLQLDYFILFSHHAILSHHALSRNCQVSCFHFCQSSSIGCWLCYVTATYDNIKHVWYYRKPKTRKRLIWSSADYDLKLNDRDDGSALWLR